MPYWATFIFIIFYVIALASSKQCQVSNPRPLDREPSALTTRPGYSPNFLRQFNQIIISYSPKVYQAFIDVKPDQNHFPEHAAMAKYLIGGLEAARQFCQNDPKALAVVEFLDQIKQLNT